MAGRYASLRTGRSIPQNVGAIIELSQKCTDYLHLRSDQPQKAASLLEQQRHLSRWEIRSEGEIRIYETVDAKAVGQTLAQSGVAVEEMSLHRQDLESYFLERMGEEKHV